MLKNGRDGVMKNIGDCKEYVAFRSSQIQILSKEAIIESYLKGVNLQLKTELDLLVKGTGQLDSEKKNIRTSQ